MVALSNASFWLSEGKVVEGAGHDLLLHSVLQFTELSLKCKVIIFYKWPEKVLYEYGIVVSAVLNCFPYGHLLVASSGTLQSFTITETQQAIN